jgi:hypothetical protein
MLMATISTTLIASSHAAVEFSKNALKTLKKPTSVVVMMMIPDRRM